MIADAAQGNREKEPRRPSAAAAGGRNRVGFLGAGYLFGGAFRVPDRVVYTCCRHQNRRAAPLAIVSSNVLMIALGSGPRR